MILQNSSLKKPPLLNIKRLQYPLFDLLTILHQLCNPFPTILRLLILARVVRDVHRDHHIRTLFFQTQQHEMDVHEFRHLAAGVRVGWWRLNEFQSVHWFVATEVLAGRS
jgi:hypothetical protein